MGQTLDTLRSRVWGEQVGPRRLTLLVGSSPLPNLIAALALAPDEVALICSEKTAGPAQLLVGAIKNRLPETTTVSFGDPGRLVLPDAHHPAWIRAAVEQHAMNLAGSVLFYAGGTKTMATHVHGVLTSAALASGRRLRACYLADATGQLLFDDGYVCTVLDEVTCSLEELAYLHGITDLAADPPDLRLEEGRPTTRDAELLWLAASADPGFAGALFRALTVAETGKPAKPKDLARPCTPSAARRPALPALPGGLSLRTDLMDLSANKAERWIKFLRGTWFEVIVCRLLAAAQPGRETGRSVKGTMASGRTFELDAAQVGGARLYAVSCTIAAEHRGDRAHTKLKAFEVERRAKQLGGDLARSVVVSLHSRSTCVELEHELAAVWRGDEPPPCVFGIDDLREWTGGTMHSLSEWLLS